MSLLNALNLRRNQSFEPSDSVSYCVGVLPSGHFLWEPSGKARENFEHLCNDIKDCLEASNISPSAAIVTWSVYMIGRRENSALPRVIFCSANKKIRKDIRALVKRKVMDRYPGIGLGDVSQLPGRGVIKDLDGDGANKYPFPSGTVFADDPVPCIGKRIYIVIAGGGFRMATGGPLFFMGNKLYQLTVAHTARPAEAVAHLSEKEDDHVPDHGHSQAKVDAMGKYPSVEDYEFDFDGMCDEEEGSELSYGDVLRTGSTSPQDIESDGSGNLQDARSESTSSDDRMSCSIDLSHQPTSETPSLEAVRQPSYYGRLSIDETTWWNNPLDYALVCFPDYRDTLRLPMAEERMLQQERYMRGISPIRTQIQIQAAMPEHGWTNGVLSSHKTFIRLPGSKVFQLVYPVHLDVKVSNGDCGAPVVEDVSHSFYGHIIAGGSDSHVAYIIPASNVIGHLNSYRKDASVNFNLREAIRNPSSQLDAKPYPFQDVRVPYFLPESEFMVYSFTGMMNSERDTPVPVQESTSHVLGRIKRQRIFHLDPFESIRALYSMPGHGLYHLDTMTKPIQHIIEETRSELQTVAEVSGRKVIIKQAEVLSVVGQSENTSTASVIIYFERYPLSAEAVHALPREKSDTESSSAPAEATSMAANLQGFAAHSRVHT